MLKIVDPSSSITCLIRYSSEEWKREQKKKSKGEAGSSWIPLQKGRDGKIISWRSKSVCSMGAPPVSDSQLNILPLDFCVYSVHLLVEDLTWRCWTSSNIFFHSRNQRVEKTSGILSRSENWAAFFFFFFFLSRFWGFWIFCWVCFIFLKHLGHSCPSYCRVHYYPTLAVYLCHQTTWVLELAVPFRVFTCI